MEFVNETTYPASIARAQLLYKDLLLATVVLKCTFEFDRSGEVRPAEDQEPIYEADVEMEHGSIDADIAPIKAGCDFAVLGSACASAKAAPVKVVQVSIAVGRFERTLLVFGDRTWMKAARGIEPSDPEPFTAMPIAYDRAYGGDALHFRKMRAPYHDNPAGKGYVHLKEHVVGTPLPNVEEADQRIQSWEDRPLPAGLAPVPRTSTLRGTRGIVVDLEARTTKLEPLAFSFAHPRMQLPAYPAGERMTIRGMHPEGPLSFVVPELSYHAGVELGEAHYDLPLVPDTLCVFPDQRRFFVVARRALVYQYLRERERTIRITADRRTDGGVPTSIREQRGAPAPVVEIGPEAPDEMILPFDMLLDLNPLTGIFEALPLCPSG